MAASRAAEVVRSLDRYLGDCLVYLLLGVLYVHEVAGQVLLVGSEVEVTVAAEVEEDDLLLTRFFGFEGEVYGSLYGVRYLGRGYDTLGSREEYAGLERRILGVGAGLDEALG